MVSIDCLVKRALLRWADHVVSMDDGRMQTTPFYYELVEGRRNQGGQKNRFNNGLRDNLKKCNLNIETEETVAKDRSSCAASTHKGTTQFETDCIPQAKHKHQPRKDRLLRLPDSRTAAKHTIFNV